MALNQLLVYLNGATTSGQAEHEGFLRRGLEGIDAVWCWMSELRYITQGLVARVKDTDQ